MKLILFLGYIIFFLWTNKIENNIIGYNIVRKFKIKNLYPMICNISNYKEINNNFFKKKTHYCKKNNFCISKFKKCGYKIQVFNTKDRNKAKEKMKELINIYYNLYPELQFERPEYKLLLGNYFYNSNYENDLRKIKKKYPHAFIVTSCNYYNN